MLEHFLTRLSIIENEFGKPFLENKPDDKLRATGKGQHPVRYHWRQARSFLRSLGPGQRDIRHESLAYIDAISFGIEETRRLPGFDSEIRPRLKDWRTFDAVDYEIQIGLVVSRFGAVEFLRKGEGPSSDLRVSRHGQDVMVECSKKQRLAASPVPSDIDSRFREPMFRLLQAGRAGIDAILVVLDTDPSVVAQAMASAEEPIASGQCGVFFDEGIGACLVIRDLAPLSPLLQVNA
jgi:hypothetical protein